jgi:integrase/recombinase XerD
VRLDDAVTYFLGEWPSEGPTLDTWRSYAGQLKWLVGFAAKRSKFQLADLTPELLRAAMVQKMDPKNHSLAFKGGESGAKALLAAARKFSKWLRVQGMPAADLSTMRPPRVPERIQTRLRPEEFQAIETAILKCLMDCDRRVPRLAVARDLALIYLLADTGLRANEVCAMELRSVDFDQGAVLVLRGKGKKERALSLVDPNERSGGVTLKLLADWIDMRASVRGVARTNKFWVSMKGNPLTRDELRKILGRICTQAGISSNRPPHTFRRANFTESYKESPESIRVLAARMGWSDKSHHMIDIYTRGADLEIARDTPVPSLSARWRDMSPKISRTARLARPMPAKRPPAASSDALAALIAAVKTDPALRRALLQALNGAA